MKIGDIIELGQYTIETPSPEKGRPVSPIPWRVIDSTDEYQNTGWTPSRSMKAPRLFPIGETAACGSG